MLPPREPRGVAARHSPRIAVRVAPHSRPAAGARKAGLELALTADRSLLLRTLSDLRAFRYPASDVFILFLGRSIKWNARFTLFSPRGVSHDESEFTHRPAGGVSRERQYVLPDKQHRLRHRTEFPIFGCTTRAILESTSLG